MSSLRDNVYKKATDFPKVKLGISSCLLGDNVRFNGGHVKDRFLADSLGRYVDWVPVCPEVEIGMGVPRENIRLVGDPDKPKLIAPKSGTDYTYQMESWAKHRVEQLKELGLHGYVLKSDSPSCGLSRVRVYGKSSVPVRKGTGVFARELSGNVTAIALEEEGRLKDYRIRENFVERIFTYQRWNETVMDNPTPAKLVSFHTRHKCILMAHNQRNQTQLGRLVATAGTRDISDVVYEYEELLVQTMNLIATNKKNTNVIHHLMGFLKTYLDEEDKKELLDLVEQYRMGLVPLLVPLTLLQHYIRRHPVDDWVKQQEYLNPYPSTLGLRNQP